jgi:anti-anti-sigma factor
MPDVAKSFRPAIAPRDCRGLKAAITLSPGDAVADACLADPKRRLRPLRTPVARLYRPEGTIMGEQPELPDRQSRCLPHWTALAGATGALAWGLYSDGHLLVAALDGELDLASGASLARQLDPLARAGRHLILDLDGLSFCDCAGLSLILRWQRQAAAACGALHLVAPRPRFRRLVALTGSSHALPAGALPCDRHCCVDSHLELRPPAAGPARAR